MQAKKAFTAADIRSALRRRYCQPEASVVFEVAQGTGSQARRHLDAVAMELWPSRGLALHGIEIKVSVSDWRREKADPTKAEEIARFCDYFWIAAPPDVIPIEELPSAWGLLVLRPDGAFSIGKQAHKTEAQPLTRNFLAALLRASSRVMDAEDKDAALELRAREQEARFQQRVQEAAKTQLGRMNEDADSWRKLREALGKGPDEYLYAPEVISAVKFVIETHFVRSYGSVRTLHDELIKATEIIGQHLKDLDVPAVTEMQKLSDELSGRTKRRGAA